MEKIVFVGAGNLASCLAPALHNAGYPVLQVYSRTETPARALAQKVGATWTTSLAELNPSADIYLVALKDDVLPQLLPQIADGKQQALLVHTAGSLPMSILKGMSTRYGVCYPLQTFSREREIQWAEVPFFIESNSPEDTARLYRMASALSAKVYETSSPQRQYLHLAAVLAGNFTNHLYALAANLLQQHGLPFEVLLPLIDETARKVHTLPPREAQTGPAVRYDQKVMGRHTELLSDDNELQQLYKLLSESIHRLQQQPPTTVG